MKDDLEQIAKIIKRKNVIDDEVAAITGRPALIGHTGEYIASRIFDIKLEESATQKAIDLVRMAIEKVKLNEPLTPIQVPMTKKALVVGGGISGIEASVQLADLGHKVILVEKGPTIGGKMAQLNKIFPDQNCSP